MIITKEQYIVDENGKRTAVLLEIERYEKLLEAQEELASINAFDEAKRSNNEVISFSQAMAEIEEKQ